MEVHKSTAHQHGPPLSGGCPGKYIFLGIPLKERAVPASVPTISWVETDNMISPP